MIGASGPQRRLSSSYWILALGVMMLTGGCTVDFTGPGSDCGNGVIEGDETCDDDNGGSGDGCGASCQIEDGWSCSGEPSVCETECGDGVARGTEACDASDLRNLTCAQLGLGGGELSCAAECVFNTSGCDYQAVCGNGAVEYPEECDGTDLNEQTCADLGFDVGELLCTPGCAFDTLGCDYQAQCGDDEAEDPEECDGTDLAGETCESLGLGSGTLRCSSGCAYDVSDCSGSATCGNATVEFPEVCDGASLGGGSCLSEGFYGGSISCGGDCNSYDLSGCSGECGDDVTNGPELCDGLDMGGLDCTDYSFYSGTLTCQADCGSVNVTGCSGECGDGVINGPEECDGANLDGDDCVGQGHYGGTLACQSNCTYDYAGCHLQPRIVINEVSQGWPDTIELLNLSEVSVNLLGWLLEAHGQEVDGTPVLMSLDIPNYDLAAGERVVLRDQTNGNGSPPTVDVSARTIQYHDNILWDGGMTGGAAILINNVGVALDFVRWGPTAVTPPASTAWSDTPNLLLGQAGDGVSLSRVPDGGDSDTAGDWCVTVTTDGLPNGSCMDPSVGSTVLITEVDISVPDRVELYNAGPSDVNLLGWTVYFYDDNGPEGGGTSLPSFVLGVGQYVELVDQAGSFPPYVNGGRIMVGNIAWTPPDAGGCGLVDPANNGKDFVRWESSASQPWFPDQFTDSPGPAENPNNTYSLGRLNLTDTDTAGDWCRQVPSLGAANNFCN